MYRITVEECGNNKEHVMCFRSQGSGVFSEDSVVLCLRGRTQRIGQTKQFDVFWDTGGMYNSFLSLLTRADIIDLIAFIGYLYNSMTFLINLFWWPIFTDFKFRLRTCDVSVTIII